MSSAVADALSSHHSVIPRTAATDARNEACSMRSSTKWLLFGSAAGAAASLAAGYGLVLRPWHLRWGATRDETRRPFPFDGLIPAPNYFSTRAITIDAPPARVFAAVTDDAYWPAGTIVRNVRNNEYVVFAPPEPEAEATWVVVLDAIDGGAKTRLLSRCRARFPAQTRAVVRYLLVDPGQFVFERAWMRGVRKRSCQ